MVYGLAKGIGFLFIISSIVVQAQVMINIQLTKT